MKAAVVIGDTNWRRCGMNWQIFLLMIPVWTRIWCLQKIGVVSRKVLHAKIYGIGLISFTVRA